MAAATITSCNWQLPVQEEEGIVNPQDDEVSSGESEPMEDTAADEHAMREDLDYRVEGVGKPATLETNTNDDCLHSVPVAPEHGMFKF